MRCFWKRTALEPPPWERKGPLEGGWPASRRRRADWVSVLSWDTHSSRPRTRAVLFSGFRTQTRTPASWFSGVLSIHTTRGVKGWPWSGVCLIWRLGKRENAMIHFDLTQVSVSVLPPVSPPNKRGKEGQGEQWLWLLREFAFLPAFALRTMSPHLPIPRRVSTLVPGLLPVHPSPLLHGVLTPFLCSQPSHVWLPWKAGNNFSVAPIAWKSPVIVQEATGSSPLPPKEKWHGHPAILPHADGALSMPLGQRPPGTGRQRGRDRRSTHSAGSHEHVSHRALEELIRRGPRLRDLGGSKESGICSRWETSSEPGQFCD